LHFVRFVFISPVGRGFIAICLHPNPGCGICQNINYIQSHNLDIQYAIFNNQCIIFTIQNTIFNIQFAIFNIQFNKNNIQIAISNIHFVIFSINFALSNILKMIFESSAYIFGLLATKDSKNDS